MNELGKIFLIIGIVMISLGIFIIFLPKIGFFKLPGDIYYKKNNFTFYFPITTSIIISLILTLLLNLLKRN